MAFFWLLYSLDDRLVDPEADGDREKSQDEVRNHTDDTESCQRKQHDQCGAKDKPSFLHISPENQIVYCQKKREHKLYIHEPNTKQNCSLPVPCMQHHASAHLQAHPSPREFGKSK